MTKILFILKRREDYNSKQHTKKSLETGLYNSAKFMCDMLVDNGVESKMVTVIDNNCIDREVAQYKPSHVIIEALWVVPQKFIELTRLHPTVTWVIRLHSDTPFLAQEGMAFDWIGDYSTIPNVVVAANSPKMLSEVRTLLKVARGWTDNMAQRRVIYLPNFYPHDHTVKHLDTENRVVNVGCFGAIRPLKNHVLQAVATLRYAERNNKIIHFHVNHRIELQGDATFKNLRMIFAHVADAGHRLFIHDWMDRDDFVLLCSTMDFGMQVSFSETFNIVAADLVGVGVPIIGSKEIPWLCKRYAADPTDSEGIAGVMELAMSEAHRNVIENQISLKEYTTLSEQMWLDYFLP